MAHILEARTDRATQTKSWSGRFMPRVNDTRFAQGRVPHKGSPRPGAGLGCRHLISKDVRLRSLGDRARRIVSWR